MIGGWQHNFFEALAPARGLAIVMAGTHLRTGHDVVMPQLVTDLGQAVRFEEAAARAQAAYVEVAFVAAPAVQIGRFRGKASSSDLDEQITRAVDSEGGDALLEPSTVSSANTSLSAPMLGMSTPTILTSTRRTNPYWSRSTT